MRDPIDELRGFDTGGLPVNPLPPAEVRRRGDRMRRRRNAIATAGGVAAVAVLAVPLAMVADRSGGQDIQPAPAPRTVEWRTEIPSAFPLADGLPDETVTGDEASGVQALEYCGGEAWSVEDPAIVDRASVEYSAGDHAILRTLSLYPDDAAAARAMDDLRSAVEDCASDPNDAGFTLENQVVERALDADASFLVTTNTVDDDGTPLGELGVVEVVRTGNALFLDHTFGAGGGGTPEHVAESVGASIDRSRVVLANLCVFAADPCDSVPTPPAPEGEELPVDVLPTEEDTVYNEAVDWSETTTEDEAGDYHDVCLRAPLDDAGATDTVRRDFVLTGPEGTSPKSHLRAVVAQFPTPTAARFAYEQVGEEIAGCAGTVEGLEVAEPTPVGIGSLDGEARVYQTRQPVPGSDDGYFREHGLAVVGDRLLLISSQIVGQDYSWAEGESPVSRTLAAAAPRLAR